MGWNQTLCLNFSFNQIYLIGIFVGSCEVSLCGRTMRLNQCELKAAVGRRIRPLTLQSLINFVKKQNPALWGQGRTDTFVHDTILLALYKDLYNKGYHGLFDSVKLWYPTSHKSLGHNTKVLRKIFAKWARQQIVLGTLREWQETAKPERFKGEHKLVYLWLDTSNFRLDGKASASRKNSNWSYKTNSPAQRYAFLSDAAGKLRKVWGGYSPKVYDGYMVEVNQEWFETALAGATVIADSHFEWGTHNLEEVTFKTPISKPKGRRKKDPQGGFIPKTLTAEQQAYNKHFHTVCSRIENPFGRMQSKFDVLKVPFREGKQQLDCVVWLAAALINAD